MSYKLRVVYELAKNKNINFNEYNIVNNALSLKSLTIKNELEVWELIKIILSLE